MRKQDETGANKGKKKIKGKKHTDQEVINMEIKQERRKQGKRTSKKMNKRSD